MRIDIMTLFPDTVGAVLHESIIGSLFRCEIVDTATVAGFPAVVPRVTGNACIQGFATWILDPKDTFPEGFLLG